MVFKLLQAAQGRWRAVNGPHLVAHRVTATVDSVRRRGRLGGMVHEYYQVAA